MWIGFVYHLSLDGHFILSTTLRHILSGSGVDLLINLLNCSNTSLDYLHFFDEFHLFKFVCYLA